MTHLISLHRAFDAAQTDWLHLVPAGTFSASDGRGPFSVADADALIARSMSGGKLVLDENHSTDIAAPQGQPAPARGWIVEMQAREDGIWGKAEYTAAGKAMVDAREYRGISPVLMSHPKTGEVSRILRASLCNDPSLPLKTLHQQQSFPQEPDMNLAASIRAALGLKADADDAAILESVKSLHASAAAGAAEIAAIAEAAGSARDAKAADIVTAVKTLHAGKADASKIEDLVKTVHTLQADNDALKAATATDRATRYVDDQIKVGKPIRALREHYISRHMKDSAAVEKEVGAMISINSGGITGNPNPDTGGAAGLTLQEVQSKASLHQKEQKAKGVDVDWGTAVRFVTAS